ncbi:MAG: PLDc N-terminal domain-containing protein [Methanosarcina sp.]|uniref:PLDc N-terminal domain-containing protein n=1 Tax=Methanosarcina sp. TaxID=2213 RepID=UPI003BB71517
MILFDIWGLFSLISFIWVIYDLLIQNRGMNDMMKIMWIVVSLIFGILGAILYFFIGRRR